MIWFNALILSEAKLLFLSLNTNLGIAEPDKKAHILFWYTFSNLIVVIKLIKMKTFLKILLTALAVIVLATVLPGVSVSGYLSAIIVAVVIALLNMVVKPLLIFFTLPATIVTFGLFLFVINAIIILLADKLVGGFAVSGFFAALLFSILLSIFRSVLFSLLKEKK
jgi:putative membrane protein